MVKGAPISESTGLRSVSRLELKRFESSPTWRTRYLGPGWDLARVRGTRFNTGDGIEMALALYPSTPQVAVFDTAFHQTMPARAYRYAVPTELYEEHGVRVYGFHGTSHLYVTKQAIDYLGRPPAETNLITAHLGNGCSVAAVEEGRSVETSMGMTPLEGLVMGTRCGDIDSALIFFVARTTGLPYDTIEALLEGWKHDVRNLWWVVDYNRQSLDAVVSDRLFGRFGSDLFTPSFETDTDFFNVGSQKRQGCELVGGQVHI